MQDGRAERVTPHWRPVACVHQSPQGDFPLRIPNAPCACADSIRLAAGGSDVLSSVDAPDVHRAFVACDNGSASGYFASGSGRSWNFTSLLVPPLPSSAWKMALAAAGEQRPQPFHPT